MIPLSSVSETGLNKESIISTLGLCVRTDARYREIKGHSLELTTLKNSGEKNFKFNIIIIKYNTFEAVKLEEEIIQNALPLPTRFKGVWAPTYIQSNPFTCTPRNLN